MKLSLKNLLLLVATAALGTLSATTPVEHKALEGDVALVEAQATTVTVPVDAQVKSEDVQPESRFIRTTAKVVDYIVKNRAYVVKRIIRDLIYKLIKDHFNDELKGYISHKNGEQEVLFNLKDKTKTTAYKTNGSLTPDSEGGAAFRSFLVEGGVKSAVIATLDASIKTDKEHWALSAFLAGFFAYVFEQKGIDKSIQAALEDYLLSTDFAEHLGKHSWAYYLMPFFVDAIKERKFGINFEKGIGFNVGGFLAFNPKTRVPTFFDKSKISGKFGDSFVKNFLGRGLIPGFLAFLFNKHSQSFKITTAKNTWTELSAAEAKNLTYEATMPSKDSDPVYAYKTA